MIHLFNKALFTIDFNDEISIDNFIKEFYSQEVLKHEDFISMNSVFKFNEDDETFVNKWVAFKNLKSNYREGNINTPKFRSECIKLSVPQCLIDENYSKRNKYILTKKKLDEFKYGPEYIETHKINYQL
jgi:hypothetical protein